MNILAGVKVIVDEAFPPGFWMVMRDVAYAAPDKYEELKAEVDKANQELYDNKMWAAIEVFNDAILGDNRLGRAKFLECMTYQDFPQYLGSLIDKEGLINYEPIDEFQEKVIAELNAELKLRKELEDADSSSGLV